ncbi:substrate-binding periplasmic protein [Marinobacter sp.]|uniref:substrate-binding periplasmic protein n=1 Tax=Marinobacter sp. TaxID=50741 RepID=UPI00384ADC3E
MEFRQYGCIFCFILLFAGSAAAEEGSIRLGTGPDYPPFADRDMEGGGIATQLVKLVFERMGRPVELENRPWNRLIRDARGLRLDAIFPYVRTPEREEEFLYSDGMFEVNLSFFASQVAGAGFRAGTLEKPVTLCRPNGYALNEDVRPYLIFDFFEWIRPSSMQSCFRMMARGRVDMIPINQATGRYIIEETFGESPDFPVLTVMEENVTHHLLIPKGLERADELMASFNRELAQVMASDEGQEILGSISRFLTDEPL